MAKYVIRIISVAVGILGIAGILYACLARGEEYTISPKIAPVAVQIAKSDNVAPPIPNSSEKGQKSPNSPIAVREYVMKRAKEAGVNVKIADWVVGHESQYGVNMSGDDGKSVGYWQFNLKANPQVSYSCAMDLKCSTDLALNWILNGKLDKWSTYRFCRAWYPDCPF